MSRRTGDRVVVTRKNWLRSGNGELKRVGKKEDSGSITRIQKLVKELKELDQRTQQLESIQTVLRQSIQTIPRQSTSRNTHPGHPDKVPMLA